MPEPGDLRRFLGEKSCGFCFTDGVTSAISETKRKRGRKREVDALLRAAIMRVGSMEGALFMGGGTKEVKPQSDVEETRTGDWSLQPSDWGVQPTRLWRLLVLALNSGL
jgi:hypothetical protein